MGDKKISTSSIENMSEQTGLSDDLQNTSISNVIGKSLKYFNDGLYLEAINEFYSLLAEDESGLAQQYVARCYFRMEKYKLAYGHFEKLLKWEQHKDYALSMMATIKSIWGQHEEALKMIKRLPSKPNNLINQIYLLYYVHKSTKKEWILDEAEKLTTKLSTFNLNNSKKFKYYLACGMIKQAAKQFSFALGNFKYALTFASNDFDKAQIYNEIGFLYMRNGDLVNAELYLVKAYDILKSLNKIETGINFKLLGILERHKKSFKQSRWYLQEALKILNEKETYFEACEVHSLLLEFNDDEKFYEKAGYFTTLTQCENGLREVNKLDEKIIDILDNNYDDINCDDSNHYWPILG